jgi:hypothetical protein
VGAKKIRIPAGVVREISGAAMAPARSIAPSSPPPTVRGSDGGGR